MVFQLILLALVGIIAYFHFTQGLFTATISAILAVFAAMMAVSYFEPLAQMLLKAGLTESASAVAIILIFAVAYFVPRLLFDMLVPGNIRVPVLLDKIGAAVMGVIVGLFATGVLAIAMQALPFSQSIGMFTRYSTVGDRPVTYVLNNRNNDGVVSDQLKDEQAFSPDDESHLILRQDELVLGLANKLSSPGASLEGDRQLASIHPDYLQELFADRIGIQVGAKHTIYNTDTSTPVKATGVYTQDKFPQVDEEMPTIQAPDFKANPVLTASGDEPHQLVVVGVKFSDARTIADDTDSILRLSPGAVRLMVGDASAGFKDYYPIATLDDVGTGQWVAFADRLDDPLFIDMKGGDKTAYFVYDVLKDDLRQGKGGMQLPEGSLIAVKHYGISKVGGDAIADGPPPPAPLAPPDPSDKKNKAPAAPTTIFLRKPTQIDKAKGVESAPWPSKEQSPPKAKEKKSKGA